MDMVELFEVTYRGQIFFTRVKEDITEFIEAVQDDLEEMKYNDVLTIRKKQISLEEFNNMPAFNRD